MARDILELLNLCAVLENEVAQLYKLFTELYHEQKDLAELWEKTADEEENHMRQFQLAARLTRSTMLSPLVEPATVINAIDTVTRYIDKFRQNPPEPQSALKFAIDLEKKLEQFHMDTAVASADDTINDLFRAMMTNDNQHVQSLNEYLVRYASQIR